jgi:hypothetical protein
MKTPSSTVCMLALIAGLAIAQGHAFGQPASATSAASAPSPASAASASSAVEQAPVKVLYIGNSYTYYFRMPAVVSAMAKSSAGARPTHAKLVVAPGATLQSHWESGEAQAAIRERKWDYVVLQEQSLRPLHDVDRMLQYARLLGEEIRRNGAQPVLFATWARRSDPALQDKLDAAYQRVAADLNAQVAPVGQVWRAALIADGTLRVFDEDGSHPSAAGSYLAACVIHLTLQPVVSHCPVVPVGGLPVEGAESIAGIARRALRSPSAR